MKLLSLILDMTSPDEVPGGVGGMDTDGEILLLILLIYIFVSIAISITRGMRLKELEKEVEDLKKEINKNNQDI